MKAGRGRERVVSFHSSVCEENASISITEQKDFHDKILKIMNWPCCGRNKSFAVALKSLLGGSGRAMECLVMGLHT